MNHISMNDIVNGIERQINGVDEDTEAVTLPFPQSLEDELQLESRRPPTMVLRKIIKPTSSVLPMMLSKLQTSTLLNVFKVHNMSPLAVLQAASIIWLSMPNTEIEFGCTVSSRSLAKSHDDIVQQQIALYISYLACLL